VLDADARHGASAARTANHPGTPSPAHLVQRSFEKPGAQPQDRIAYGKLAGFEVERSRGLDAPQQNGQLFILFRLGFVFF
jgi:hypothetical protein